MLTGILFAKAHISIAVMSQLRRNNPHGYCEDLMSGLRASRDLAVAVVVCSRCREEIIDQIFLPLVRAD